MDWLYYLRLLVALIAGLFITLLGLPGLWVMVGAAALYAWITAGAYVAAKTLVASLLIALVAEVVEFVAGSAGAKKAGASKRGMLGAIIGGLIGGVVGSPFIPVIGTIVGACLGSFVGAFALELMMGRELMHSAAIGYGAAKGRFFGIVSKLVFGAIILLLVMIAGLPLGGRAKPLPAPPAPATASAV